MSDLNVFVFDSQAVRVVMVDGEPWFVGKDVAEVLGYTNHNKALGDHCKGVTKRYPLQTPGGIQEVRVINEPDMLRLIVSSKLPSAEQFERWVFEEVLPSIRKTGSYSAVNAPAQATPVPRIASHEADRIGIASRTFTALLRAGQGARLPLATAIRRAAEVAQRETGVNLLDELQAHGHVQDMEARAVVAQRPQHHMGAVNFWEEWAGGQIEGLPYQTCTCAQAYAAYTQWCSLMREGDMARREVFTIAVMNAADQTRQPMRVKPMNIGPRGQVKTERVLLVTPPPLEGQGAWATALVTQFAEHLRAYLAQKRSGVVQRSP